MLTRGYRCNTAFARVTEPSAYGRLVLYEKEAATAEVRVRQAGSEILEKAVSREKVHDLKSWPHLFNAIASGEKKHELRRWDDRHFEVGDVLQLNEFDPRIEQYTGRYCLVRISYITSSEFPCALSEEALSSTHCILSIEPLPTAAGLIVRSRSATRSPNVR